MYITIVFLIVVCVLFIVSLKPNIGKIHIDNFTNNTMNDNKNIWLYWENIPNKKKPVYIDLCYDTIVKNCKNFNIYRLDEKNVYDYLPNLRKDLNNLKIPQKADYIRYSLLYKYGGIWLDSDIIVINDLSLLLNYLKKYDFVGFGCHDRLCNTKLNGYPKPANWCLVSKKKSPLMEMMVKRCDQLLNRYGSKLISKKYHSLGRELLWECIQDLRKKNWDYHHYGSRCIERDSDGNKIVNYSVLKKSEIDKRCLEKYLFIPIYNTAPGFPKWFLDKKSSEILKDDLLISKLFRLALKK